MRINNNNKRRSHALISVLLLSLIFCSNKMYHTTRAVEGNNNSEELCDTTMKRDLLCLILAYPEHITGIEASDGKVFLLMKSGRKIIYDDKKEKTFEEKLNSADVQDMMEQAYPLSDINTLMPKDYSPGRIRCYPLMIEVYGHSKEQIQANIINVSTGCGNLSFNKSSKAAESLKKAMDELAVLSKGNRAVSSAVFPTNGTFNYRRIAGTGRLSPHSFGTAIDLARDKRDYWKWASKEQGEERLKSYPREVVKVFEKNNFIWGGKWHHFDILHFEYRPELVIKALYFGRHNNREGLWYSGAPVEEENVKRCIEIIEGVFN
jgi:hypothetical protein